MHRNSKNLRLKILNLNRTDGVREIYKVRCKYKQRAISINRGNGERRGIKGEVSLSTMHHSYNR